MVINFIYSKKGFDETRTMHTKSNNVEIKMGTETNEILKNFLNLFCKDIKKDYKNQREKVNLFMIVLMHCIMILIK